MESEEKDWKKKLTPEQYKVLREKGIEAPFTGKFWNHDKKGMYKCAACGSELFSSDVKFETRASGLMGWPSFHDAKPGSVKMVSDKSHGMDRTEVICAKCGSHLGHLFDDVPGEGNKKHFCINSICLDFKEKK